MMKKLLFISVLLAFGLTSFCQPNPVEGDYRTKDSGSWYSVSNWETYSSGSWIPATSLPNPGGSNPPTAITILDGHTMHLNDDSGSDMSFKSKLVVNEGGEVKLGATVENLTIEFDSDSTIINGIYSYYNTGSNYPVSIKLLGNTKMIINGILTTDN